MSKLTAKQLTNAIKDNDNEIVGRLQLQILLKRLIRRKGVTVTQVDGDDFTFDLETVDGPVEFEVGLELFRRAKVGTMNISWDRSNCQMYVANAIEAYGVINDAFTEVRAAAREEKACAAAEAQARVLFPRGWVGDASAVVEAARGAGGPMRKRKKVKGMKAAPRKKASARGQKRKRRQ